MKGQTFKEPNVMSKERLRKSCETSQELRELVKSHYKDIMRAVMEARPIAWVTAGAPIEVLYAMGVQPVHPENAATVTAARRLATEYIEEAEALGYSQDCCSYMKTNIAAVQRGELPRPDFLVTTGSVCDTHVQWFWTMSRHWDAPVFVFDIPHLVSGDEYRRERYYEYIIDQCDEYIAFVEKQTDSSLDEKKFREVLVKSDRLAELWLEIYEYRKKIPCPIGFADMSGNIFPMVALPGLSRGVEFYERLLAEVKQRAENGAGVIPNEQYRLLFDGIPMWYNLSVFNMLEELGCVIVYEPYTFAWAVRKNPTKPMESMATALLENFYNYNLARRTREMIQVAQEYRLDGAILHSNLSCRPNSLGMLDLKAELQKQLKLPAFVFTCDMNDPRAYSEEQARSQFESFVEVMMMRQ